MRQAIVTTYRGPTDSRGARVIAKAQAGRKITPWDHALDVVENHKAAAMEYAARLGWDGSWLGGALPGGGYVWVQKDDAGDSSFTIHPDPAASAAVRKVHKVPNRT